MKFSRDSHPGGCILSGSIYIVDLTRIRYPEILKMETDILREYWRSSEVVANVPKQMARVAAGELPHCAEILTTLFKMSD